MGFKTDYKDDIINTTSNEKRQYEMIQNDNGTVSFNDVTVYEQVGDTLGAKELNEISEKLNISGERIRYNNVTDMVQILNDDGVWEDWSSGSTAVALLKNGIITTKYYSDSLEISTEYSGFSYFYPTSNGNYVVFNNDLKSYFGKYIKIVAKSDTSGATVKVNEKFQTSIIGGTIDIVTLSLEEYEKSFYVPVQYIENCNVAELELNFGIGSGVYIKTIEITASDGTEGGGGSDDVELTQAEYDALPDTKLTDNKNYFINDATENNGNLVRNGKSYTGGGSGSGYSETLLYENTDRTNALGTYNLSDSFRNYDSIVFELSANKDVQWNVPFCNTIPMSVIENLIGGEYIDDYSGDNNVGLFLIGVTGKYAILCFPTETTFKISNNSNMWIKRVYGIKY